MTFQTVLKAAEKFVMDNSPTILTSIGAAGTITTALVAGRGAYRVGMDASTQYHEELEARRSHGIEDLGHANLPTELLEPKHLIKTYWKEFIPAAIMGTASVTCIIMANRIGTRRTAAIAAAFKLSEELSEQYREKVAEALGKQKNEAVRADAAKEQMLKAPDSSMIVVAGSEVLFFDMWSGRWFKSEMETVRRAVNEINHQVNNHYFASLTEFYDKIGLGRTDISDQFGWNTDQLLEVTYDAVLMDDGRPAISIDYNKTPIRGYDRCQ